MTTPVQGKVILSSSDTTTPVPALQASDVPIPIIPIEAPSLEGRLRPNESNVPVETSDLAEICGWIKNNTEFNRVKIQRAAQSVKPSEDVEEGFVIVGRPATIPEISTETDKSSQPSLLARVSQGFWSVVSYFNTSKK